MKEEYDFQTILDVALEGPEISALNISILHGLLREVFKTFDLSHKKLVIESENSNFSNAYHFIKNKVDNRTNIPGPRKKVSIIVGEYARSAVGHQSPSHLNFSKSPVIPSDIDDRLRYIESQMKIVKNFPSVEELKEWAHSNAKSDTIVTDLWHFVSLNHRMDGAEEGIQKLTELVDKLIPELKKLTNVREDIQIQIDELQREVKDLDKRSSIIENRIENAASKITEKGAEIEKGIEYLDKKLNDDYAKLEDLKDFVLWETFAEKQGKAAALADQITNELANKAPIAMVEDLVDQGEVRRLKDWVNTLRSQMETLPSRDDLRHLDLYVKWPQLEEYLCDYPKRPGSRDSYSKFKDKDRYGSTTSVRSNSGGRRNSRSDMEYNGDSGSRCSPKLGTPYPSNICQQKLNDLGRMSDRQSSIMDAIERIREKLDEKVEKSDLKKFLTEDDLKDLINQLKNLKIDVDGIHKWREIIDDEKLPALRKVLGDLEQQVSDLLNNLSELNDEDKRKQKAIETLFTYIDRLEENKLEKDDPDYLELKQNKSIVQPNLIVKQQVAPDNTAKQQGLDNGRTNIPDNTEKQKGLDNGKTKDIQDLIQQLEDKMNNMEIANNKSINDILNELNDKLDRSELQPLRDYLENRYNYLTQQLNQQNPSQTPGTDSSKIQSAKSDRSSAYEPTLETQHYVPTPPNHDTKKYGYRGPTSARSNTSERNTKPGVYDNNYELGCSHPLYGDNTFVPAKKNAALIKHQMKFNCLSCDRPLTMQSDSHFQTVRGRQLNAYELDSLRLLQKILKGDNPDKPTRACGGKHTSTIPPSKKLTAKLNAEKANRAAVSTELYNDDLTDGEIDIEGLDGRYYRGLISKKDLRVHLRSRSCNDDLRTVSPLPKGGTRPVSNKSYDLNSSYTSGMGTAADSIDIHIETR